MSSFYTTPTMRDFMMSEAHVRVLAGPIGAGKSVCCAHELMRWAMTQEPDANKVRKTRFLVVRNTVDQLRSTTMKTIFDWFPPTVYGNYRSTEKTIYYKLSLDDGTRVESEWMMIALDTPDDVRKALSLECTGIWGNECRELHPDVVDGLLMRVDRYPSRKDGGATRAGAIFDTNMPGEGSYWQQQMDVPPNNWEIFIQPPAVLPLEAWIQKYNEDPPENLLAMSAAEEWYAVDPECDNFKNLSPTYYINTLEGKKDDFIRVYLQAQFGRSLAGLPVYDKTFWAHRHIAAQTLDPVRSENYPLCIGLDLGRTPAACMMQLTPSGHVNILSEITSENMGIQTFITQLLKPHLFERFPGIPYYVAPDPAGWQKTQVGETSPVDILRGAGFQVMRPITNDPKRRIESFERLLNDSVDAEPKLRIDPRCEILIRALRGGYRWRVNKQGELAGDASPMKNFESHIAEAAQYAALVLEGDAVSYSRLNERRAVVQTRSSGWT